MSSSPPSPKHLSAESLGEVPLFSSFDEQELSLIAGLADLRSVESGTTFLHQGEKGESMFVMIEGEAVVNHRADNGGTIELGRVGSGDFFGEVALMDEGPRSADVVTLAACKILEISHSDISMMAMSNEGVALKFFIAIGRKLVERARAANCKYVKAVTGAA